MLREESHTLFQKRGGSQCVLKGESHTEFSEGRAIPNFKRGGSQALFTWAMTTTQRVRTF